PVTVKSVSRRSPMAQYFFTVGPSAIVGRRLPNVRGLVIHVEQAGYLAGYLSGLMETRRPGKDVVGAVGGIPQVPDVANYIGGFRAGARKADRSGTALAGYSRDFA